MKQTKTSKTILIAAVSALLLIAVFITLKLAAAPAPDTEALLSVLIDECRAELPAGTLASAAAETMDVTVEGEAQLRLRSASLDVTVVSLDTAALTEGLEEPMQEALAELVSAAKRRSDIYDEEQNYLPDVIDAAYESALNSRLSEADEYMRRENLTLKLRYSDGEWKIENKQELSSALLAAVLTDSAVKGSAAEKLEYIEFHYTLPDRTSPGPKPNPLCFGETDDPAVITTLLQSEEAVKLIGGQTLDWSADKELIPGTKIRYYLDETILCLVWQEVEHGAVGTFSEVFIADASQLRRKLADDTFGAGTYYYPTELAAQANAVLGLSGDFYDLPGRVYGVYAYDGKLMNSCLYAGQTCYFTDSGDMIFSYENQFADNDEAQRFLDENNVMFSLSFGPVILDDGVDVTPYSYPLGEVLDTYARCCIGQLGERHYLSMTINCLSPDYYVYVTLRQAADSMIAHGCKQAYTLDGGQTGSIILGNKLINPVQFGVERRMSDIFYFATAIPE